MSWPRPGSVGPAPSASSPPKRNGSVRTSSASRSSRTPKPYVPSELPATRLASLEGAVADGHGRVGDHLRRRPGQLELRVRRPSFRPRDRSRVSAHELRASRSGSTRRSGAAIRATGRGAFSVRRTRSPVMAGSRRFAPDAAPSRAAKRSKIVSIRGSAAIRKRPSPSVVTVAVPWMRISLSSAAVERHLEPAPREVPVEPARVQQDRPGEHADGPRAGDRAPLRVDLDLAAAGGHEVEAVHAHATGRDVRPALRREARRDRLDVAEAHAGLRARRRRRSAALEQPAGRSSPPPDGLPVPPLSGSAVGWRSPSGSGSPWCSGSAPFGTGCQSTPPALTTLLESRPLLLAVGTHRPQLAAAGEGDARAVGRPRGRRLFVLSRERHGVGAVRRPSSRCSSAPPCG